MDAQYRRPIMGVVGSPIMGAVGHPEHICAGCPYPSDNGRPYLSKFGSPHPSMSGGHVCPYWKSTSIHVGRPCLPILEAHIHPCWAAMFAHVGSPHPSTIYAQCHPSWKPNPCCRVSICKKWTPKKDGNPPLFVATHLFRWPRELYASGCPIRVEDDHTELWAPIALCGHEKRNAWMQVDAHIYAWAHIYRAKKKSPLPKGE